MTKVAGNVNVDDKRPGAEPTNDRSDSALADEFEPIGEGGERYPFNRLVAGVNYKPARGIEKALVESQQRWIDTPT